jgi:cytochrome c oxidase accessory protein FixG
MAAMHGPSTSARVIPILPATEKVALFERQRKVYPRSVRGVFSRWRWFMVWVTQAAFYGLPWLPWHGRPAVLFDLVNRRFYLFDLVLYPQDFIYLTGLLVLSAFGLFFVTAVGGRLWCGHACPQTVYTEVFLWVERRIEGERGRRMKLDASPWTAGKLGRKALKHGAWLGIAWWTGLTFVGYFTPIRQLWGEAFTLSFGPWEWFWVNFYGLATYGNAGFLREQVCKYMCPYARFQGAMFDRDTLVVSYDPARGEPRGKWRDGTVPQAAGLGDCIDCGLCVQVCPVGIDIRDGQQYECIACAVCIDACDGVMDKVKRPRGLVRYATLNGMALGLNRVQMLRRVLRPRVLVYGTVLVLVCAALWLGLARRSTSKVDVVRDRASLARLVGHGDVENLYRLQLMNAAERARRYRVRVQGIDGASIAGEDRVDVAPTQARWLTVAVRVPQAAAKSAGPGPHPIRFLVDVEAEPASAAVDEKSTFVIPR